MASLGFSFNTTHPGFVSAGGCHLGPLERPVLLLPLEQPIRHVLSGKSWGELESFHVLEGSLTAKALALPPPHPQPHEVQVPHCSF